MRQGEEYEGDAPTKHPRLVERTENCEDDVTLSDTIIRMLRCLCESTDHVWHRIIS